MPYNFQVDFHRAYAPSGYRPELVGARTFRERYASDRFVIVLTISHSTSPFDKANNDIGNGKKKDVATVCSEVVKPFSK